MNNMLVYIINFDLIVIPARRIELCSQPAMQMDKHTTVLAQTKARIFFFFSLSSSLRPKPLLRTHTVPATSITMRAIDAANWREPSTSSSPTSSPATAPRKNKQLTCWFWKKQGSCCWSAEECKFSHEDTGNMSFMPRQLRYTAGE